MHLKSNVRWFLEETQCLYESCMSFILFSLAVTLIIKLHNLVRFSTSCFVLLQCINLSSFHVLSVLKRKQNLMYLVDCGSAKRLAVLHNIYIPLFGFNDVHQREVSLSSSTVGCKSCHNRNQNSETRILSPFYSLIRR